MSARVSRWRALKQFHNDIDAWVSEAKLRAQKSANNGMFTESDSWVKVDNNCMWMRDRIRHPNLAPTAPRRTVRTVLVPWSVYKRLERQAAAWQNARVKRKAQIRRMKK